jgi:hypothetical protein
MISGIFAAVLYLIAAVGVVLAGRAFWTLTRSERGGSAFRAAADNNWRNEQYAEHEGASDPTDQRSLTAIKGTQMNIRNWGISGGLTLIAILEAHAKMESAKELAQAEVIRAEGAAKANHILQNSLGGPEGYLRYLQIQAYGETNAKVIYVPTEGGLPITEAGRLPRTEEESNETGSSAAK